MKNKTLVVILAVVVVLALVAVCVGLKSCAPTDKNSDLDANQNGITLDDTSKDEDGQEVTEDDSNNMQSDVAEDIGDWDDATEGAVGEKPATKEESDDKKNEDDVQEDDDKEETSGQQSSKTYTITYDVNNQNATIESTTQQVAYGEAFTLITPQLKGGDDEHFVKWVIKGTTTEFKSGTYTLEKDVTLTAVWEQNYSKNY